MSIDENERIRTIKVVPYDKKWIKSYIKEAKVLKEIFKDKLHSIHHIGSTAIIGAHAKPTIDIMPLFHEIDDIGYIDRYDEKLQEIGYVALGEYNMKGRRFFYKGKEPRLVNMHAFKVGNEFANKHLLFKEFLNIHPKLAEDYSKLKIDLSKKFPHDIESYVNGKSEFVSDIFEKINNDLTFSNFNPFADKVQLVEFDNNWSKKAADEIKAIKDLIKDNEIIKDIQHIGSTSINGVMAKPIIDIMIGVDKIADGQKLIKPLESLNYQYWEENPDKTKMFFVKGMPPHGEARTHHVHVVEIDDLRWQMRILFRDFLNNNEKYAKEYQELKLELATYYTYDREAYTILKSDFVKKILKKAGFGHNVYR